MSWWKNLKQALCSHDWKEHKYQSLARGPGECCCTCQKCGLTQTMYYNPEYRNEQK